MQSPEIGIVVPSYNDKHFLRKLIHSLWSKIAGSTFSVVIVDDHSTDGTQGWVTQNLVDYVAYIQPGAKSYFTRCVNFGIDYALQVFKPNYILLLNSDIEVTDYWASGMIGTAQGQGAGIVGATLHYPNGHVQHLGAYGPGQHMDINKIQTRGYAGMSVPWVTGAAMMIRSEVIYNIGLLPFLNGDPVQYDQSDREMCKRTREAGYDIWVSPTLMYHDTITSEHVRRSAGQYNNPAMMRVDR